MMKQRLAHFWLEPAPPERLALVRILSGWFAVGYVALQVPRFVVSLHFSPGQFMPVGVAALLPGPLPALAVTTSVGLSLLLGVAFALGAAFRFTGPAFALLLLWITTYRSSWGMIFHTDNLLTLHIMLLSIAPAADALSWDARRARLRGQPVPPQPDARFGWPLRVLSLVTVLAYALAGIAKLKLSGGTWLGGELLRAQIAYDNLRKIELGTAVSPLGPWLVRHPAIFPPLAIMTLLVELGAPLALASRRIAKAWVPMAWGFHVSVLLFMSISFPYPLSGIAYLSLFPIERAWERLARRWFARRPRKAVS